MTLRRNSAQHLFVPENKRARPQGVKKERPQAPSAANIPTPEHGMREKSSLESSHRPSPRSRCNAAFASKIRKILESNPEADLSLHISNYSTQRLNRLRGASTTILSVPDVVREPEVVLLRMPEPCGHFSIVAPLAPRVQTLIRINPLETSNGFQDSVSVFWRLLRDGTVLHQVLSKWIVKITALIVVKFARLQAASADREAAPRPASQTGKVNNNSSQY